MDQLLADEQVGNGDLLAWTLSDNENTVRDLARFNGSDTTIVNHRVFSAYGQLLSQTNPSAGNVLAAVDCLFAYTGRPMSVFCENSTTGTVTGLQNNGQRWYDPITARWLSQDPSGFGGGDANLYRYCGNARTDGTDPSGLADEPEVTKLYHKNTSGMLDYSGEAAALHAEQEGQGKYAGGEFKLNVGKAAGGVGLTGAHGQFAAQSADVEGHLGPKKLNVGAGGAGELFSGEIGVRKATKIR